MNEEWLHRKIYKEKFANSLYYEHCDFREQKHYRRISNREYVNMIKIDMQIMSSMQT
jgi:hypothetical protein